MWRPPDLTPQGGDVETDEEDGDVEDEAPVAGQKRKADDEDEADAPPKKKTENEEAGTAVEAAA